MVSSRPHGDENCRNEEEYPQPENVREISVFHVPLTLALEALLGLMAIREWWVFRPPLYVLCRTVPLKPDTDNPVTREMATAAKNRKTMSKVARLSNRSL